MELVSGRPSSCMAMAVGAGLPMSFVAHLPALPQRWRPRPLPAFVSLASPPHLTAPFAGVASMARFRESFELSDGSSQPVLPVDQAENGPIELPAEVDPLAGPQMSPLGTAGSVVLTGAIAFFLFRALRKRAKRSTEMRFRSSGVERVKVESEKADTLSSSAVESVNVQSEKTDALSAKPGLDVTRPPPSALQTILGGILSGVIAYYLYQFATYVEGGFAGKPVSSDYTIRQLTITIRTIINGMCYLATFVFAANSIGLTLYSLQLALNLGQIQPPGGREDETNNISELVEPVPEEITEKE